MRVVVKPRRDSRFSPMDVPVLLLIRARPSHVRRVVDVLRAVGCRRLCIGADGPRAGLPRDGEQCHAARSEALNVGWNCSVATRFLEDNQGCEAAVSGAITWFFENHERGIVLEEDCVPNRSFFAFCERLLDAFADHPRVGAITGNNFQRGRPRGEASYYFSRYPHCWGWATWRRAWQCYDREACARWTRGDWSALPETSWDERAYWACIRQRTIDGRQDSWANRWTHSLWRKGLLTATPQVNLVENIGIGADATHTRSGHLRPTAAGEMQFPLVHPEGVVCDTAADRFVASRHFRVGRWPLMWAESAVRWPAGIVSEGGAPVESGNGRQVAS
jgi:hypothetical protein